MSPPRPRKRRFWIAVAAFVLTAVAAGTVVRLAPLWRSTDSFLVFEGDPRIRFEPGAEQAAAVVARALPQAIVAVERARFRPFAQQVGARDGLPAHLFYRESAMFVGFLARENPRAFERMLLGIQDRKGFATAVREAYGRDLSGLWADFSAAIKSSRL